MTNRLRFALIITLFVATAGCSTLINQRSVKRLSIEKVWVRDTPEEPYLDFRRLHRMAPILTDSLVIAGNSIDGLVAYDRDSADEVWRLRIDGGVEAGVASDEDFIYFGAGDGFFYKVNKSNGEVSWSFPIRSEGLGQPTVSNGYVYFIAGDNIVYCLDINTGKSLWLYNRRDPSNISVRGGSRPSVDEANVYVGFSDGYVLALKKDSGAVVWETIINTNKRFQDVDSHPFIDADSLYVAGYDHSLRSLNKFSGESQWELSLGGYSTPLLQDSILYYASTENKIVAIQKSSGQKLWEKPLNSLGTQPQQYLGLIVVGEYIGRLKFLDLQTGQLIKEFSPGRGVHSAVTLDSKTGDLYFMSADANLFYLKVSWDDSHRLWPWEQQ